MKLRQQIVIPADEALIILKKVVENKVKKKVIEVKEEKPAIENKDIPPSYIFVLEDGNVEEPKA